MAASGEEVEDLEEINYYAILNVSKEASIDDIKSSYRRQCKLFHPDRHVDSAKKEIVKKLMFLHDFDCSMDPDNHTVKLFNQLQKAYEVLGDQDKRAIYDIYGQKGLDANWEVIARQRTPAEIQEEYERLQRQKEEERLQRRTNPKGTFVIGIDGTEIFEQSDEYNEYSERDERALPNIEVCKMTINQSIEAPLTTNDTVTLSGNLAVQNGNGNGHVSAAWRRVISTFSWAEVEFAAGNGPMLQLRAFRNLTHTSYGSLGFVVHKLNRGVGAGFQSMVARQLGSHTTGYVTWKGGSGSSLETSVVTEYDNSRLQLGLQLGVKNCFVSFTYHYQMDVDTRLRTGMKLGLLGSQFSYGADRKISEHSNLGASVTIGSLTGVVLKIRLTRSNQTFVFPISLADSISPMAIFYGTVTPLLLYYSITTLVVKPFLSKAKERETKEKQEKFAEKLATMKKNAEEYIELMRESYEACVECERKRHGLVIVNAWYGNFFSFNENDLNNPYRVSKVVDVTIALQCQVKDSKLFLTESSKAQINGFYDPCIGEEKSLRVRYLFRDNLHEVTIDENEALVIPRQSHRLQSSTT